MSTVCDTLTTTTLPARPASTARRRATPAPVPRRAWRLEPRRATRVGESRPILNVPTTPACGVRAERPTGQKRARWRAAPYQAIPIAADDDSGSPYASYAGSHSTGPASRFLR